MCNQRYACMDPQHYCGEQGVKQPEPYGKVLITKPKQRLALWYLTWAIVCSC